MIQLLRLSYFSLCRVLRPPGGGSNISLGTEEEKPPVRKNKMASSVFAEPEDPYANRRNNPPGTMCFSNILWLKSERKKNSMQIYGWLL